MKLVDAWFVESTGQSIAIVKHKGGKYTGVAQLHPDEECGSKFTGCRYAEIRAQIKALKNERKEKIAVCEECRKFIKICSQYKGWDKESSTAKAIYTQLNKRIKEVNKLTNEINRLMWDLNIAIKQQESVHKKLATNKSNSDNLS